MTDITIVASGWSARPVVHRLGGTIIAVNGAATALKGVHVNYALTMDRLFFEGNYPSLFLAVMSDSPAGKVWVRRSAIQNFNDKTFGIHAPLIEIFDCDYETPVFAEERGKLNGTNSGGCAMNLAYQLRPKRLFMVGFDMNRDANGNAYWHEPHPWAAKQGSTTKGKYSAWAKEFRKMVPFFNRIGCEVFNVSLTSAITAFPKIPPREYFKLLKI